MEKSKEEARKFVVSKGITDPQLSLSYENMFRWGYEVAEKAHPQNVFHYELGVKMVNKKIKDKINHLKSDLSGVVKVKLTKTINEGEAEKLRIQIGILESLINK